MNKVGAMMILILGAVVPVGYVSLNNRGVRYDVIDDIRYRTRQVVGYEGEFPIFSASCVMIDGNTAYTAAHVVEEWIACRQPLEDPNQETPALVELEIEGAGRVVEATVVDPNRDLAIIKVEGDPEFHGSPIRIARRADLKVGMTIILSGYSALFGLNSPETTAIGNVSEVVVPVDPTVIIIASSGGPGSSGGGVWTTDGRLIGVVSSGGMGFVVISVIE